MSKYKVDVTHSDVFINDILCDTLVSLHFHIDPRVEKIECEVTCVDKNEYTGYWEEHRTFGYIERVYTGAYYVVIDSESSPAYFQQFIAA
jgi:hypothetical protein